MNLYLLKMKKNPEPGENEGFVIRAGNEQKARILAVRRAEDEGAKTWLDPSKSNATVLAQNVEGKEQIILESYWGE